MRHWLSRLIVTSTHRTGQLAFPPPWLWGALQLAQRDLKVRYKNSALGFVWSFINPVVQIVVLTIVFKYIMGAQIKNFSMELFTCFLPWMFFAQGLSDGAVCVAKDVSLVKKYVFPKIILPLASLLSNLVHLLLGFAVLALVFLVLPVAFQWSFLWVIPLLLIQCVLMLGLVLMLGTLQVYYEDIRYLIQWGTQLLFFLCPIVYSIEQVAASQRLSPLWKELYLAANPLTPLFIGYRTALLHGGQWPVANFGGYLLLSLAWSVVILVLGLAVWRRYEWHFAEIV